MQFGQDLNARAAALALKYEEDKKMFEEDRQRLEEQQKALIYQQKQQQMQMAILGFKAKWR